MLSPRILATALASLLVPALASADNITWQGTNLTSPGLWDVGTTPNFLKSGVASSFTNGDAVFFDSSTEVVTVTIAAPVPQPLSVQVTTDNAHFYTFQGAGIGGAGTLTKNGVGDLTLLNANTFTGATTVNGGRLVLGSVFNGTSFETGSLASTSIVLSAASTRLQVENANSTSARTISAVVSGSGRLVKGVGQGQGQGAVILTGNNSYTGITEVFGDANGPLQIGAGGTTGTLGTGNVVLQSVDSIIAFNRSDAFTVNNTITGQGRVQKLGSGVLTLNNSNSYADKTTISAGAILLSTSSLATSQVGALGNKSVETEVTTGGTLQMQGNITYGGEGLFLSGEGVGNAGTLRSLSGNNTWDGDVTIVGAGNIRLASDAGTLTIKGSVFLNAESDAQFVLQGEGNGVLDGKITGVSRLIRSSSGFGNWTLNGANDYTNFTTISNGSLTVKTINSLNAAGNAAVLTTSSLGAPITTATATINMGGSNTAGATTGALIYTGTGESTNRVINLVAAGSGATLTQSGTNLLEFTSAITVTATGATKTLTLNGSSTGQGRFSGAIGNGLGTVGVTKSGTGTWTLAGANSYTGPTNINGGTLALATTGALGSSTAITLAGGATLDVSALGSGYTLTTGKTFSAGTGTARGMITGSLTAASGSTIAPGGTGQGIMEVSGSFSLNAGAHLALNIAGTTAGSGYDQIIVNGPSVTLGGDFLGSLVSLATNVNDLFYLIIHNGAGSTTGLLNGYTEGQIFSLNSRSFQISYTSDFNGLGFLVNGSGNDVALKAVPEPSVLLTLAGGVGVLSLVRRSRRA